MKPGLLCCQGWHGPARCCALAVRTALAFTSYPVRARGGRRLLIELSLNAEPLVCYMCSFHLLFSDMWTHQLSSEDAVKRVLSGEKGDVKGRVSLTSRPQESDNKHVREEEPRGHKEKEDRRNSEIKERSPSRDRKQKEELKEDSKPREKDKEQEKPREPERDGRREPERDGRREPERDRRRDGEREKARARARQERDRDAERDRERRSEAAREKERLRGRDRDKGKDRDQRRVRNGEHSRDPNREKSREQDKLEKKSTSSGEISKKLSDGSSKDPKAETEVDVQGQQGGKGVVVRGVLCAGRSTSLCCPGNGVGVTGCQNRRPIICRHSWVTAVFSESGC
uniref:Uncharacterized protein n=1 Tax=Oryctolagus cuniculus TaxID=9986 RepID=G1SFL9_RABIT